MKAISSISNPMVKRLRALDERKGRQAAGAFLLEGTKLLAEAVAHGMAPLVVMASAHWWDAHRDADWVQSLAADCYEVNEVVLKAIATTRTPDPVVAMVRLPVTDSPVWRPGDWVVLAHQLQDPGNLGTIIRAADAAGAALVVVTDGCVDPYSPKVVRASMGSLFHVPVVRLSMDEFRARYPACPVHALALDGEQSLYDCDLRPGGAFLIGNEGAGLPASEREKAHRRVYIPMPGKAESLNAAMAATVCMFEAARQQCGGSKIC